MKATRQIQRLGFISLNALRQVLVSVYSMVIPFLVIRYVSKDTWGSFVSPLLFTLISVQVINWGNKEYLLRSFSIRPDQIRQDYSRILLTRLPLVFIFTGGAFIFYNTQSVFWIFLWLLGRYLSHAVEALIVYEKDFNWSILIETISFAGFLSGFFLMEESLTMTGLLMLYSSYQFFRGILFFIKYRKCLIADAKFDSSYYKTALPFFLLSILGFLASKVDVYLVEHLGDKLVTANYQVINSLFVFTMSLSAFIYAPFTKNLYRNTASVIHKTKKLLGLLGLIIVPASLVAIHFIVRFYLNLNLPLYFYVIGFIYIYPSFIYGIEVVNLFRQHREQKVVLYLFSGAFANTLLSGLFLYSGFGIPGAMAGSALAQCLVLLMFRRSE